MLTDFAQIVTQTFAVDSCFLSVWNNGQICLESSYGIPNQKFFRQHLESIRQDATTQKIQGSTSGILNIEEAEKFTTLYYQAWNFEIQDLPGQGLMVLIKKHQDGFQLIDEEKIKLWLTLSRSLVSSELSKAEKNEAAVYKAILDNSSEYLVLIDSGHKILEYNSVANKKFYELNKKELKKGEDYRQYLQDANREVYQSAIEKAIQGGKFSTQIEYEIANESYWLEYLVFPVYDLSRTMIGVCLKGKDITREKKANLELASLLDTFNALSNNLNESLVILSKDYKVIQFNSRAKDRLQLNFEKEIENGQDFREFIYEGGQDVFLRNFQEALNGKLVESEGSFFSQKGDKIWLQTRYIPISLDNGESLGVGLLTKNITEEKNLQFALQESEKKFRKMVESAAMAILIIDSEMKITMINPEVSKIFGYSEKEIIGQSIQLLIPNRYHQVHTTHQERYAKSPRPLRMMEDRNTKALKKNGDEIDVEVSLNSFQLGDTTFFMAMVLDVSERNKLARLLKNATELTLTGHWEYTFFSSGEQSLYWSPMTRKIFEVPEEYVPQFGTLKNFFEKESYSILENSIDELFKNGKSYDLELRCLTWTGNKKWIRAIGTRELLNGDGMRVYGSIQDIHNKKVNELELVQSLQSVKNYKEAIEQSNLVLVTGLDGIVLEVNDSWCKLSEYSREELIGASSDITKSDYHPDSFFKELWDTIRSGKIWKGEIKDISKNGNYFWVDTTIVPMKNEQGEVYQFLTLRNNITEKKKALEDLEIRAKELARSNSELEQFAYVASHDLQEPLRMVTSFLTQLKRKYADQLDEKAKTYIDFAVEGGHRMRNTILDLLEFSRAGKGWEEKEKINLNRIVEEVLRVNRKNIEQSNAQILVDELPIMLSYNAQLLLVFSNLISNAIKYRKPEVPPIIKISVKDLEDHYQFSISDNGIGFSMEYSEKIFVIFQRLHTRADYEGNGIGLAIVRKVIESLHGKIWVESKENIGTSFFFTLPK